HLEAHRPAVALRQVLDAELIDQADRVVEAVVAVVRERPATRRLQPGAAAGLVEAREAVEKVLEAVVAHEVLEDLRDVAHVAVADRELVAATAPGEVARAARALLL